MLGKRSIIAALFAVALAYVAYPYVTLYRLGSAIRDGNGPALEAMVDWPAVREGIKEDICDLVIDEAPEAKAGTQLPPFGAGFMRGIAGNAIDARVTPAALVAVAQVPSARPAFRTAKMRVSWAFFDTPTQFMVDLRARKEDPAVRLQLDLRNGAWRVTRVWLPAELLDEANARTVAAAGSLSGQTDIAERIK
jgi:hypothetical protein